MLALSFLDKDSALDKAVSAKTLPHIPNKITATAIAKKLGILEKDNGSYSFPIEPWTIGFEGANTKMKKAGEYVIIDLDLLWKEDDPCWEEVNRTLNLPWFKEYEERYQRERKLKK